MRVNTQTIAWH